MIPCKDCLTLGLCKHKEYADLIQECSLLNDLLYIDLSEHKVTRISRDDGFDDFIIELDELMGTNFREELCLL